MKIGFVYVGPIGDYGWTHGHDLGRKAVEAHFGDRVKTTYVESVAEGPDAERVMRQLVQQGHGLIFTTSFGYMEQTLRVAKQFPKLKFEHATGYKTAANMSAYNARFYEGRAVVGRYCRHADQDRQDRLCCVHAHPGSGDGDQRHGVGGAQGAARRLRAGGLGAHLVRSG